MGIFAECLRKEMLIERFKMKRNDLSKHLLPKKNERETKVRCENSAVVHVKVTLSCARHMTMCSTLSGLWKILSEVDKFLEDGHAK